MKKISFIVLFLLLICIPFSLSATLQKQPEQVITENTTRLVASPVTIDRTITTFPWGENFEGAAWPPTDWVVIESATTNAIIQDIGNNHTTGGTASLRFSSYNSAADYTEYARSPEISLTGVTSPMLSFWFKKTYSWATEELYFAIGTSSDVTTFTGWTPLTLSEDWANYEMDLSSYVGQNFYIGFMYYGDYMYYVNLDDVEIYDLAAGPSCCSSYVPANGEADILENGAISWSGAQNADQYTVYFGSSSGNYDIVNGTTITATSYPYSGLSYGMDYFYKIVPGDGTTQAAGCPEISFTVRNDPTVTTFPWMEDFSTWPPANWSLVGGSQTWGSFTDTDMIVECALANFWNWSVPNDAYMTTPPIQVPSTGNWLFSFDWSHAYNSSYPDDQGILEISTNGSNWTELWNLTGSAFDSGDGAGSTEPGSFANAYFPLASYAGQTVLLRFHAITGYGPDFFIDNVQVLDGNTAPSCANVVNPADAGTDVLEFGTLSWTQPLGATTYDFYLGTSAGNYDIVNGTTVTATAVSYSGLNYGSTYYWKVVPGNQYGSATGCPEWSFTTRADPTISAFPHLVDFETTPNWLILAGTGTWGIQSFGITGGPTADHTSGSGNYGIFNDANPTGTVNVGTLQTTPFDVSGMTSPALNFWYWIGTAGSTADQSTLYLDIYDGATWNEGVVSYGMNGQWQEVNFDLASYVSTGTTFRFRAVGTATDMSSIGIDDFAVFDSSLPPACTANPSPTDAAVDQLDSGTLTWDSTFDTDFYTLYIGTSSGNYDIVNGLSVTSTSYNYSLDPAASYYWMVTPGNSDGSAAGCPEWTFSTIAVAPGCATYTSPADAAIDQIEFGTLEWSPADYATSYQVYLGETSGNYNIVNGMSVTNTSYGYSNLTYGDSYYWMVVPVNAVGPATGCAEQSFTVRNDPTVTGEWSTTFDTGIPADWFNGTEDLDDFGTYTSSIGHGAYSDHTGSGTYLGFDDSGTDGVFDYACLYTTPFDFSGISLPKLSFWYWIGDSGDTTNDQSTLYLDTYDGSTWTTHATSWGHTGAWTEAEIDLSVFTGVTTFRFRAQGTDLYYSDVCIDDFMIYDAGIAPVCVSTATPADSDTDVIETGLLSWVATSNTDNYTLYLGRSSGNYDIVNGLAMTATSYAYSTLEYNRSYFWKVVPANAYGSPTGCPEWTFTTRANPTITTMPWLEEFTNWAPANWTLSGDRTWAQYNSEMAYCNFWGWNDGTAIMTTPPVQLPATGNWALNFDWSHQYNTSYPDDQGIVQISTDGSNWTELWNLTGSAFESNDGAGSMAPGTGVTETFPLDAYLGQTVYFQIVGVSGYGPNFYVDNFGVNTYVPPTAKAMVNVFLGGAYSADNDNMNTGLNGFLPLTSPYADGIAVTAMPTDVVDWISVELRQTADGATIEQRSGLLLDSGMIVDVTYETDNTVDYISFTTAIAGDYFVVIRHRNHSDIMSAAAATLPADPATATAVDFTTDAANAYTSGPAALFEAETGVYVMYPGDIDGNGSIIASDATLWQTAFTAGVADGYHYEDIDMDGSVIAGDNSVWKIYFTAGAPDSQVPDNSSAATTIFSRSSDRAINNNRNQRVNKTLKLN